MKQQCPVAVRKQLMTVVMDQSPLQVGALCTNASITVVITDTSPPKTNTDFLQDIKSHSQA